MTSSTQVTRKTLVSLSLEFQKAVEAGLLSLGTNAAISFGDALERSLSPQDDGRSALLGQLADFVLVYEALTAKAGALTGRDQAIFGALYDEVMLRSCDHLAYIFASVADQYPRNLNLSAVVAMLPYVADRAATAKAFREQDCPHMARLYEWTP